MTMREEGGNKNDNHRHFNNMQRYKSTSTTRASVATIALYNDKDMAGSTCVYTFRSTKGAA